MARRIDLGSVVGPQGPKGDPGTFDIEQVYPVGSVYMSVNSTNPGTLFGGTWERIKGRVLVGVDESDSDFNSVKKTGGEKSHTLTVDEMPRHSHEQYVSSNSGTQAIRKDYDSDGASAIYPQCQTGETGGDQAHNNLQPYYTVYIWVRAS